MSLEDPLVIEARTLAERAHAGQLRKSGEGIPYFRHLENVAQVLATHGHTDRVLLAAAYLHDLLEDQPGHGDELRRTMPAEVIETVELLTEAKADASGRKRPKMERFRDYVMRLSARTPAARRALSVSCADKIDNARSLAETERNGRNLLAMLNTRPGEHAEQLSTLRELFVDVVNPALLETFDDAARGLMGAIDAWLPGRAVVIAAQAHLGRFDPSGAPAIDRPLRLMLRAARAEERLALLLKDAVSSEWTPEALAREGFGPHVLSAIERLSAQPGEPVTEIAARAASDPLATRVMLLELEDRLAAGSDQADRDAQEILRTAFSRRSLVVRLSEPSQRAIRALAVHTERRGDHLTLAHRVDPDSFDPAWIPGGRQLGERVSVRAVGLVTGSRVQALAVEMEGLRQRPFDGQPLHVTVSRHRNARSVDANELLAHGPAAPIDLELEGVVTFCE